MARRQGGWYKQHFDLEDPRIDRLGHFEFRLWEYCKRYCNESPAELRRAGELWHDRKLPVSAWDLAGKLHCSEAKVRAALEKLGAAHAEGPLLRILESGVIRITNWRRTQEGVGEPDLIELPLARKLEQ